MYPHGELILLDAHKTALRRRIARHRDQCADEFARATEPLAWLDRAVELWRRISPLAKLAALPLALVAKRVLFRRSKLLGSLFRWGPVALGLARSLTRTRR